MNLQQERTEIWLGNFLRYGVLACALVLFTGVAVSALPGMQNLSDMIVQSGVLLLICLPIARVAFTLVIFLAQKDYFYTVITGFVLTILLVGLFLGKDF